MFEFCSSQSTAVNVDDSVSLHQHECRNGSHAELLNEGDIRRIIHVDGSEFDLTFVIGHDIVDDGFDLLTGSTPVGLEFE